MFLPVCFNAFRRKQAASNYTLFIRIYIKDQCWSDIVRLIWMLNCFDDICTCHTRTLPLKQNFLSRHLLAFHSSKHSYIPESCEPFLIPLKGQCIAILMVHVILLDYMSHCWHNKACYNNTASMDLNLDILVLEGQDHCINISQEQHTSWVARSDAFFWIEWHDTIGLSSTWICFPFNYQQ